MSNRAPKGWNQHASGLNCFGAGGDPLAWLFPPLGEEDYTLWLLSDDYSNPSETVLLIWELHDCSGLGRRIVPSEDPSIQPLCKIPSAIESSTFMYWGLGHRHTRGLWFHSFSPSMTRAMWLWWMLSLPGRRWESNSSLETDVQLHRVWGELYPSQISTKTL